MSVSEFILTHPEGIALKDLHLSEENQKTINQLIKEFKYFEVLDKFKLPVDNKIFLFGQSGCGKTSTAIALAEALDKKIIIVNLANIISSRLGETAKNISNVFKKAIREKAVLFLDEFDALAKVRSTEDTDSMEMKRVVNSVIQLIDSLPTNTVFIAASNHVEAIDSAILRRFQIRLKYEMPTSQDLDRFYDQILNQFHPDFKNTERKYSISYAEAKDHIFKAVKENLIKSLEAGEDLEKYLS